jgi:hypothetical protein
VSGELVKTVKTVKTSAQLDAEIEAWLRAQREKHARGRAIMAREHAKRRYGGYRPFGPKDI